MSTFFTIQMVLWLRNAIKISSLLFCVRRQYRTKLMQWTLRSCLKTWSCWWKIGFHGIKYEFWKHKRFPVYSSTFLNFICSRNSIRQNWKRRWDKRMWTKLEICLTAVCRSERPVWERQWVLALNAWTIWLLYRALRAFCIICQVFLGTL